MAITVAIIESHPGLRKELREIVATDPDFSCVCACPNGRMELRNISQLAPDVTVMGVNLPDSEGLGNVAQLKRLLPHTQILIFSACEENEHILKALRAGASGYLLKRTAAKELLSAIRNLSLMPSSRLPWPSP
jgi:DNA-binding NarL/FixJ family response regulator